MGGLSGGPGINGLGYGNGYRPIYPGQGNGYPGGIGAGGLGGGPGVYPGAYPGAYGGGAGGYPGNAGGFFPNLLNGLFPGGSGGEFYIAICSLAIVIFRVILALNGVPLGPANNPYGNSAANGVLTGPRPTGILGRPPYGGIV